MQYMLRIKDGLHFKSLPALLAAPIFLTSFSVSALATVADSVFEVESRVIENDGSLPNSEPANILETPFDDLEGVSVKVFQDFSANYFEIPENKNLTLEQSLIVNKSLISLDKMEKRLIGLENQVYPEELSLEIEQLRSRVGLLKSALTHLSHLYYLPIGDSQIKKHLQKISSLI